MNTKLAIGIPVYNGEKSVQYSVESLLNQTYKDFHIHIFNDCSTDKTYDIISTYNNVDDRIFVHTNSVQLGQADNFNKCLHKSTVKLQI